jgi:hypothetical protein
MSRAPIRLTGIALLLVAGLIALLPLRTFLAVDSCLDGGGSFDYAKGECDFVENHPFGTRISGPVFVGGGIALVLIGAALLVFSRRTASEPDLRSNKSQKRTRAPPVKSLPSSRRAALIAPWVVVPIVALALKAGPHLSKVELIVGGTFMGIIFAVPLTYFAVLFVGYPVYKLLLRVGWLNAWSLCSFGCTAGAVAGYIFVGIEGMILNGFCGLAVAFVAWWIMRKDLRDLDLSRNLGAQGPNESLESTREG